MIGKLEQQVHCPSVTALCNIAEVSRAGYYNWLDTEEARKAKEEQDQNDFDLILEAYKKHGYSKGARSIHMMLLYFDKPIIMNTKKIHRLMKKYQCTSGELLRSYEGRNRRQNSQV